MALIEQLDRLLRFTIKLICLFVSMTIAINQWYGITDLPLHTRKGL